METINMKKQSSALFGIYGIVYSDGRLDSRNVSDIVKDIKRYKKQNANAGILKGKRIQSLMGEYVIASRCYCNPADALREAKFMEVS